MVFACGMIYTWFLMDKKIFHLCPEKYLLNVLICDRLLKGRNALQILIVLLKLKTFAAKLLIRISG